MGRYMEALLDPQPAGNGGVLPGGAWWELLEGNYDLGWAVQAEAKWLGGEPSPGAYRQDVGRQHGNRAGAAPARRRGGAGKPRVQPRPAPWPGQSSGA